MITFLSKILMTAVSLNQIFLGITYWLLFQTIFVSASLDHYLFSLQRELPGSEIVV